MTLSEQIAQLDPALLLGLGAGAALLLVLLIMALVALFTGRRAAPDPTEGLREGLQALSGRMGEMAAASERGRTETLRLVEARLDAVADRLGGGLQGASERTARSLGEIGERLEAVDRAQAAIEKLSGEMLGLQDILANKQTRGAFGEIQLADLLQDALPASVVTLQATLSNGRRVDALLDLPHPPGPVPIDAKFPLEGYEALQAAAREGDGDAKARAERLFRQGVRAHIAAIAERYLLPGETADGALMFVPSEAVYAEIHARLPDMVREGFAKRVWIVSPTTLMATLTTLRGALRDIEIQAEAKDLRREVRLLAEDVRRLSERADKLRAHMAQAETDLREIGVSAEKTLSRARRLEEGEG